MMDGLAVFLVFLAGGLVFLGAFILVLFLGARHPNALIVVVAVVGITGITIIHKLIRSIEKDKEGRH